MSETAHLPDRHPIPEFKQLMGHPRPLWMLFMSEFWERFAFYGIRWALVLYIVAQFYDGESVRPGRRQPHLRLLSRAGLCRAIFGGYVADKIIGYQRSILIGALFMAAGLFMIMMPDPVLFKLGLATVIVGNGLFKPNISTMVGKLYSLADERRDSGFTIFYMGINMGAFMHRSLPVGGNLAVWHRRRTRLPVCIRCIRNWNADQPGMVLLWSTPITGYRQARARSRGPPTNCLRDDRCLVCHSADLFTADAWRGDTPVRANQRCLSGSP